jgi:NAD(P)-dependent dehydrogenase (short-subunit alcohol dehydrogenase family)
MGRLDGRVAIVTGAGRGLGRAHALALAAEGARVVVNDLGGDVHGIGTDLTPAEEVVHAIQSAGGEAVVSGHDVADWEQARAMVELAVSRFGDLHVVVNNAGILRDRTLANLEEAEWDAVMRVHLKGHAATTRHAMSYWRDRAKAGHAVKASLVHTTSIAGFAGNFGQAAYSAAKLGIIALSRVAALEGERYGVRSNAVSPSARTRLDPSMKPVEGDVFDSFDPANVSPIVVWLAAADCPATAQVFQMYGDRLKVLTMATVTQDLRTQGRWTLDAIDQALDGRLVKPFGLTYYVEELEGILSGQT